MRNKLFQKVLIIVGLMLVIGVPLTMIQSTIQERSAYRAEAARSIAEDSVGYQRVQGPVLVMPYSEVYEVMEKVEGDDKRREPKRYRKQSRHLVFPNQLDLDSTFNTERRHRGIHQVLMFNGLHEVSGNFVVPPLSALPHTVERSEITPGAPFLALAVQDVRGVRDIPKLTWGGRAVEFEQGSGLAATRQGLHAPLQLADAGSGLVKFSFSLDLAGMDRQEFVPVARNNHFKLKSPWPHPQFSGRFLPEQYTVGKSGFDASWRISSLATEAQQQILAQEVAAWRGEAKPAGVGGARESIDSFEVGFIEPVNVYSMADRATKYGLLFVALTFAAFFLFEVLKRLPIHPVQYALVGLALVLFFLLLVSLSEHIAFAVAYSAASVACIVLNGFYLAHVLGSWRRGLGFAVALTMLYATLFGLLSSESNALMMGAILLFAVLAAIMIATRKVNWYQLGTETPSVSAN
jgi:inner membrane protein